MASAPLLPTPPFISVPDVFNFRTIGSHPCTNNSSDGEATHRTRSDFIYRSAEPSRMNPEGVEVIRKLGITTFYDLRSHGEIEKHAAVMPIIDIPGTKRVFCPVYLQRDSSPAELARRMVDYGLEGTEGFVRVYDEILRIGVDAYRTVFTHIRDRPSEPFVAHCTAGKDRTGVFVALVLDLAGVDHQTIAQEYALTELGLGEWIPAIVASLLKEPEMEGDEAKVRRMVCAREENMAEVLKNLKAEWGGAEGYLENGLGFEASDVEKIRANILEDMLK